MELETNGGAGQEADPLHLGRTGDGPLVTVVESSHGYLILDPEETRGSCGPDEMASPGRPYPWPAGNHYPFSGCRRRPGPPPASRASTADTSCSAWFPRRPLYRVVDG